MLRSKSFVQASTAWTTRKQSVSPVFELKGADDAAQSITQRTAFAPAAVPLANYPEEENRRKENKQVDGDQRGEADADHGLATAAGLSRGARSFPHSKVAVVQVRGFSIFDFRFSIAEQSSR